jgi:hypothetical protein
MFREAMAEWRPKLIAAGELAPLLESFKFPNQRTEWIEQFTPWRLNPRDQVATP